MADLLLALLRGQPSPVNIGPEVFELLIPLSFVLGPLPLKQRLESLFRGESGPRVGFRKVVGKNAGKYAQQWVKGPRVVPVRARKRLENGCRPREQSGHVRRRRGVQSTRAQGGIGEVIFVRGSAAACSLADVTVEPDSP